MKIPNNKYIVNPVSADSGNINWDNLLQPTETWTCPSATTVSANGLYVAEMSSATVTVHPAAVAKVSSRQKARTAMPWYNVFPIGSEASLAGLEVFKSKRDLTKVESAQVNIPSFVIMGFGLMVLWVGLICFAVNTFTSIGVGSNNTYTSVVAEPTTLNITLFERRLGLESTQLSEVEQPLERPITVNNLFPAYPAEVDAIDSLSYFK